MFSANNWKARLALVSGMALAACVEETPCEVLRTCELDEVPDASTPSEPSTPASRDDEESDDADDSKPSEPRPTSPADGPSDAVDASPATTTEPASSGPSVSESLGRLPTELPMPDASAAEGTPSEQANDCDGGTCESVCVGDDCSPCVSCTSESGDASTSDTDPESPAAECEENEVQTCGSSVGNCETGTRECIDGQWGDCLGGIEPEAADSCDVLGDDANCNGSENDSCPCTTGDTRPCGSDVGNCSVGTQSCSNGVWSTTCTGGVTAQAQDSCSAPGDDADCNGVPNERCLCVGAISEDCNQCGTRSCDTATGSWSQCGAGTAPAIECGPDGVSVQSCTGSGTWSVTATCDDLAGCVESGGSASCGACPAGYLGNGTTGCTPALSALGLSSGTLSPAFSPATTTYSVEVPLRIAQLTLSPTAPAGATVQVNGTNVTAGASWTTPSFAFGQSTITVKVNQAGRPSTTYTLNVTHGVQEAYVKASNTDATDLFGYGLALSGNGSVLAVSAPVEGSSATGINGDQQDNSTPRAGAVYVFVRTDNSWQQEAYIKASDVGPSQNFGASLALSADGSTLAVSKPTGKGSVYVFARTGQTWQQQSKLSPAHSVSGDAFGESLAMSDSGDTLVVGTTGDNSATNDPDDNSVTNAGAAYIFQRSGTTWTEEAYLKAAFPDEYDYFGGAVSVSANGNTVAIGAIGEDSAGQGIGSIPQSNSASGAGAAYVFERSGTTWTNQAYVKALYTASQSQFGMGVSLSADGNKLAVGAPRDPYTGAEAGLVYLYVRTGSTWSTRGYVAASNSDAEDLFGTRVLLSDDGQNLLVGAPGEASAATGIGADEGNDVAAVAGAVYWFTQGPDAMSQHSYIKASNADPGDRFGDAIALSSDASLLVIGASNEQSNAKGIDGNQSDNTATPRAGAAYIFR